MGARYREHPLHPGLRGHVEASWSVAVDPAGPTVDHLVVPDGCIDLVELPDGSVHVAGPATVPFRSRLRPGERVRGLRFRPGAAPVVLAVGAHELRDLHVPLNDVLGRRPRAGGLQHEVLRRLRPTDPVVDQVTGALRRDPGTNVAVLARDAAISERQLRRRFHDHVGYAPKTLARVLRLQRLLALGIGGETETAARLAHGAGYADQPHMIREVRSLAGVGPAELLARRGRSVQDG